jgi:hypothetical protein
VVRVNLLIISDRSEESLLREYDFVLRRTPIREIACRRGLRFVDRDVKDSVDVFVIDTEEISESLLDVLRHDVGERSFLRVGKGLSCRYEVLCEAGVYDVFFNPESELVFKLFKFFDFGRRLEVSRGLWELSMKEYCIFNTLKLRRSAGVSRLLLIEWVWGGDVIDQKNVDVQISHLRRKILSSGFVIRWRLGRWYLEESAERKGELWPVLGRLR